MDHKRFLEQIEKVIETIPYPVEPKELYQPIQYTISNAGKRFRPVVMMMACDLLEGDCADAIHPAVSLELLHNFTLIHDDIMDQAPLRRGRETVYRKWNSNIAILSGDTLFAMAYDYLIRTDPTVLPDLLHAFNRIAIQICEGQQMDMNFEKRQDVSIAEYIEMIRLKTAVFFGGCMQIGAIVAKAHQQQVDLLYNYGEKLGIAFQLQDDILDAFGSENEIGKKQGGDIVANKKTFLYLKALELADEKTGSNLRKLFSDQAENENHKISDVLEIFNKLKVRQQAEYVMEQYYQEAMQSLEMLKADPAKKEIFRQFGVKLMKRDK
ncbi:MAG: polyprenyl synthetase family protein [Bacteroidales bacterium]|nr:polyprenyl synthetase family protein [Bacteroidales bacterium]